AAVVKVAQGAVDELGRGRRRAGREIVLLDQQDTQPAAGGVASNSGAVDAAADNSKIEVGHPCCFLSARAWSMARLGISAQDSRRMTRPCIGRAMGDDASVFASSGRGRWTIAIAMSSLPAAPGRSARRWLAR